MYFWGYSHRNIPKKQSLGMSRIFFGIFQYSKLWVLEYSGIFVKNGIFQNMTKVVCPGFKLEYSKKFQTKIVCPGGA